MKKQIMLALLLALTAAVTACGSADVTVEVPDGYTLILELGGYGLGDDGNGYKEKTENDDGSVPYVFTKKQHDALTAKIAERLEENMTDSEDWDHVTQITANEDYSEFTFLTDADSLSFKDALLPTGYVMSASFYAVMQGNPDPVIRYEFVNQDTGAVIYSSDSEEETTEVTETTEAPTTEAETETTTEAAAAAEDANRSYENNDYYETIQAAAYKNELGQVIVIHKVRAKQNATVTGTFIFNASDGSVIGKSTDEIVLTAGEANYFRYEYTFDRSYSDTSYKASFKAEPTSDILIGSRNAVEAVQYDHSGDTLYVSFHQVEDGLGAFAKFKLLFYNGDELVGDKEGFFNIYASNLTGKDTTDVAAIPVGDLTFDRVEYAFQP